jgi:membrane peptidoglycan carboxypeptidase
MSLVTTTETPISLDVGTKERMCMTAQLSLLSDKICGPLVTRAARKYSKTIRTPDHFVEMLFLVEDKRFSVHFGIDPIAIARAIAFNLRKESLQGASTIAQQIFTMRMARCKPIPRSVAYKLTQSMWALCESAVRSRASILAEYVDTVYWGRSYRGLDRAAEGYFRTDRTSLSVAQSFFLAERIAAPNRVSAKRISNLLERVSIRMNIMRNGATIAEVLKVYRQVCGNGGDRWQTLEK